MSMINEFVEKLRGRLNKELQLADEDKRKADVLQFDRAVGYANGMAIAIDILNQLEEEYKDVPDTNVGKWILCSDRLPEEESEVIVSTKTEHVKVGIYTKKYGFGMREGFICDDGFMCINTANAWQPLPQPYKGE